MVKDEVEPIGGFIGDAFVQPAVPRQPGADRDCLHHDPERLAGSSAGGIVGIQLLIIPRLRRELLRLSEQRQLPAAAGGPVGEIVDGIGVVHIHDASNYERAEIGHRLGELFDLRYRIYKRKFMVKFLNNFLAQITPFFFYLVGGYFALHGQLDIGQLVAVIAAYREVPPPLKELIDWDQQRLDVQVKYDQVVQHFAPERLLPAEETAAAGEDVPLIGELIVSELWVTDVHGSAVIDHATLTCALPSRVALISDGTVAASAFARILARRTTEYSGLMKIGTHDLSALPKWVTGRRMAYAGVDAILFPGSIRDNLVYGLRHRPVADPEEDERAAARRVAEALRTGNPVESIQAQWVDCGLAGVSNPDELDELLVDRLKRMGLEDDLYRFGLSGAVNPEHYPDLAGRVIEARSLLREKLQASGMAELVEPFDSERYNVQATVAENLLFGVPTSRALTGRNLAEHKGFREALDQEGLTDELVAMGARIAETMTEIFRGVPPGHPLCEQFSFISADELPEYEKILRRRAARGSVPGDDRTQLLALPLAYIEPRHRLGLLKDDLAQRLVAARAAVRNMLERSGDPGVQFYDFETVNAAAPLRDNLLFGRVSHSVAHAQTRVMEVVSAVIHELGLRTDIELVGLDHQVGPAGRLLNAAQRASVSLVRCIVKRPDIFVMDGALAPFGEVRARQILGVLLGMFKQQSLFAVLANDRDTEEFEAVVRFANAQAELELRETGSRSDRDETGPQQTDHEARMSRRVAGGIT